ncbi:syntaxin-5-like [Ostrea edulis]|uniref:syntaxin-5-like n=1 Tax=Ostrea edulis TaxID=37623 RepID=UPI0024AEC03C|nr:syntaxin-5-like [Ostrea edulis]XP_048734429.2 syntaxin-5-like [Ostrea edulis]
MIARRRRTNSGSESKQQTGISSQTSQTIVTELLIDTEMSCRDRTNEFFSAAKLLQSRQGNGTLAQKRNPALRQRSEFTQIAKKIGRDLANTFAKLEKLTMLAKKKSLFDDKPVEIQELTYIINQDIQGLNKQIAQLQQVARSHPNARHVQSHSNSVVVSLQSKLATMSNDFKQVLEVRTENLKHQKSRRDQFSESQSNPTYSSHSSILFQDEMNHSQGAAGGGDVVLNMDGMDKNRFQQQMQLIDQQDDYIHERADTMKNIETTIVELGGIFSQLATMVKEQEEIVHRIDSNTDDAVLNVEAAHSEILKYFQSVTSNRWLMIKIFAVLILFFIIFVVFMA